MTDNITLPRAVVWRLHAAFRDADKTIRPNGEKSDYSAEIAILDDALAEPELDAIAAKYNELLMAVAQKHPDETRHETALRYITQAENQSNAPDQAKEVKP